MIYSDILLDSSGDIKLDNNNDIILADSLIQKINIQLKWFLAEWPFDEKQGTDWIGRVFVKNPDEDEITTMIESVIQSFDEIIEVMSVTLEVDERTRRALIIWRALSDTDIIESEVNIWAKNME